MRGRIKVIEVSEGERAAVLVDASGMPKWWPNLFATISYRSRGCSHNSVRNMLGAVEMAYLWAESVGQNFEQLFIEDGDVNREDLILLANFLGYTAHEQNEIAACTASPSVGSNVVSVESVRPRSSERICSQIACVSAREHATRIYYVAAFASFVLEMQGSKMLRRDIAFYEILKRLERDVAFFRKLAPSISSHSDDESLEALTNSQVQAIEEAMAIGSQLNPFKRPFIQHRNYLLWRLFYDTGGRIGEIFNLKVEDIRYRERLVDLRISKTRPRTVSVGLSTMELFDAFIQFHWSALPKRARGKGWLWTTESGDRLSINSISQMFATIREKVHDAPFWLTSHSMRRTWNHRFSELVDHRRAGGEEITPEQEEFMRNRLNGWSENSPMGRVYNRRRIRLQADKLSEQLASFREERSEFVGDGQPND